VAHTEEKDNLQTRLIDLQNRLSSAERSKSEAESEVDRYKNATEQQFARQLEEYKVRREANMHV
jgi:uncharacterized protein YlxW (UPF0749 family)